MRSWDHVLFLHCFASLLRLSRLRALAVAGVPPPTNASCEWRRAVHLLSLFFFSWPGPTVCRQPCSRLLRFVLRHSVPSSESGPVCTQVHKRGTWQVSVLWNVSGTAIALGAPGRATGVRMGRRCTERMEACGDEASDSDGGRSTPDAQERAHYARPKILLHSIPTAENSGEQMIERSILGKHRRRCGNRLQGGNLVYKYMCLF